MFSQPTRIQQPRKKREYLRGLHTRSRRVPLPLAVAKILVASILHWKTQPEYLKVQRRGVMQSRCRSCCPGSTDELDSLIFPATLHGYFSAHYRALSRGRAIYLKIASSLYVPCIDEVTGLIYPGAIWEYTAACTGYRRFQVSAHSFKWELH
ncbi:hypothetical protein VTK56DRAFT_5187 [Thermocarpiscus australiensis]